MTNMTNQTVEQKRKEAGVAFEALKGYIECIVSDRPINEVYFIDININETVTHRFTLTRRNNDVYGNPLYRVTQGYQGAFKHSSVAHRNFVSRRYYLLQSYDIQHDLARLLASLGYHTNVSDIHITVR